MEFTKLNRGWDADLGAPELELTVVDDTVSIEFYPNSSRYNNFKYDDKGRLTFTGCHKYSNDGTNDEGYYMGQHRYNYEDLPWGDFYLLENDWQIDFAPNPIILQAAHNVDNLKHYLFFFKESTFECVALDFKIEFLRA